MSPDKETAYALFQPWGDLENGLDCPRRAGQAE